MLAFVQIQKRNRTDLLLTINKAPKLLPEHITGAILSEIMQV